MTREEAIGWLATAQSCYLRDGSVYEALGVALDALREQSVTDCNQWISTSDRLPERSGDYLVRTRPNGNNAVMHFSVRHQAFNSFDDLDRAQHKIPCSHWMPLPEPPEGGAE